MSLRGRLAGSGLAVGFVGIDQLRALFGIVFREQAFHRNFGEARIGVVAIQIGIGQLHGFDLLVQFGDAERAVGRGGRSLHDVQHFERGHALAVGRKFVDGPAAIGGGDGLDPLGVKLGEVVGCHGAA